MTSVGSRWDSWLHPEEMKPVWESESITFPYLDSQIFIKD